MQPTSFCTKCNGNAWYKIEKVASNEDMGVLQQQPEFKIAVTGKGPDGRQGTLMAFACMNCGFVEFYLKDSLPQIEGLISIATLNK